MPIKNTSLDPDLQVELKQKDRYLRNPNLPVAGATFPYTAKMLKEIKKCEKNIIYFAENYFYIVNLDKGLIKIPLRSYQKRVLREFRDNRFVVLLSSRQSGKTTMSTIYTLWKCCFNDFYRVLIVANKESTAKGIFNRVRRAYEQLPVWLKPAVIEYAQTSMTLANGSSIGITTTSSDAGRGDSCNCLTGENMVTIRNKKTGEIQKVSMSDMHNLLSNKLQLTLNIIGD